MFFFSGFEKLVHEQYGKRNPEFSCCLRFQEALILGFWWVKLQIPPGEVCQIMSN